MSRFEYEEPMPWMGDGHLCPFRNPECPTCYPEQDAYGRYLRHLEEEGWITKWPKEIHGEWVDKPAPKVSWWRRAINWWRD